MTDICHSRRHRHDWVRDRSVSIPPYLRPIEEESDNEDDKLQSSTTDCCDDSAHCRAGARDVITPGPISERVRRDVVANGRCTLANNEAGSTSRDCRQPISDCIANGVITSDDGGSVDATCRTGGGNDCTADDVTSESQSRQHRRMFYVIVASLTAFVACLTSMSPSCVICIVTVTSLIIHHFFQPQMHADAVPHRAVA